MQEKWIKCCSIIGAHFVTTTLGFLWTYGNIAPYLDSYFHFHCAPGCVDGSSQWILNMYLAGCAPGLFIVGWLMGTIGMKRLGVLSMFVCNAALFASAWTVEMSVVGTTILMGVLNGIGVGTTINMAYVCINSWAPEKSALLSGTITSVPPIIAILQNQIVTAYVNPQNSKPDAREGSNIYFSQREILERVPDAILLLAGISSGMQVIGFLLISNPPSLMSDKKPGLGSVEGSLHDHDTVKEGKNATNGSNELPSPRESSPVMNNIVKNEENICTKYGANDKCGDSFYTSTNFHSNTLDNNLDLEDTRKRSQVIDSNITGTPYSWEISQALQTAAFWAVWLYGAALGYGILLKNNYYKTFGLLYIPDDDFLTLIGSIMPLIEAIFRTLFGILINRNVLTIQDCLVLSLSLNSALFSVFYFAPQAPDRIVYVILIVGLAVSHSQFFLLIVTAVFQMFGPAHFPTLYGILYLAPTLLSLASAVLVTPIVQTLGWFGLFLTCSVLSTFALLFTLGTQFNLNSGAQL